jgi:hypothetical protein
MISLGLPPEKMVDGKAVEDSKSEYMGSYLVTY